ncbi:MAG: NADH-quinone oxidoreductase subunit NuoE [Planctomycetes bacterium]|nr:NADH-quinone oxidoreductase subunit NuoE [Planctomycetota bacterium]
MLTTQERSAIEEEREHYPTARAACVEALKVVQRTRGWISDEALRDVADLLKMTLDELDGVATFYNLIYRRPVGRRVMLLCDSVSCWIMGCDGLKEHLKMRLGADLGQTSADGRFTVLPAACLGACDHAPALMLDETLYGDVTPQEVDRILQEGS